MNLKAWCLGALMGFLVAIVPSCGMPSGNCGPNNCTGCCNAGACVAADKLTDSTCGSSGNACSNCTASNQTCNMSTKSCIGGTTGGGTSGTGGGSTAGGSTAGGSTAGGSTAGGSAGGGSAAGGAAGGMSTLMACDFALPQCPVGTECLLNDVNGTAGKCVPGACSVLQQDCTMANTKCIVAPQTDGGFARVCSPFTAGDAGVAEGATCTPQIPDPCQSGAQCLGIQGQPAPTCRRYCNPIVGCGAGAECNFGISFASSAGPSNELHLVCSAVTPCDPITQMPCAANEGCQVYRQGAPPGCLPAGQVAAGGTCTSSAFCTRGLQCVGQGGSGICRAFCNLDAGMPACAAGMCQNLMGIGLGVCSM